VERELVRTRTRLDRARTEMREREVMAKVRAEENARRKEGKGAWYLKKSEKRDLLLQARFEALEKEGGQRAVKKVVEKKRKKVAGKEKKSRPFKAGGFGEGGGKRRRVG
jgi:ribosomal RNA-processing protein 36